MKFFRRWGKWIIVLHVLPTIWWVVTRDYGAEFWEVYAALRPIVLGMGIFLMLIYFFVWAIEQTDDGL